jgi:hypothetical protein
MLGLLKLSAVVAFATTLSACATMNVSSHVARGQDFTTYQTWEWAPPDPLPETDPRLDTAFVRDHLQGAVEKEFARRHVDRLTTGTPDLLVHYHANISPKIDASRADPGSGACYDEDCLVRVLENEVGTIMVDVVDARSGRLVWRGWAQTNVEGVLDNPGRLEDRIGKAVGEMFKHFPRSM